MFQGISECEARTCKGLEHKLGRNPDFRSIFQLISDRLYGACIFAVITHKIISLPVVGKKAEAGKKGMKSVGQGFI